MLRIGSVSCRFRVRNGVVPVIDPRTITLNYTQAIRQFMKIRALAAHAPSFVARSRRSVDKASHSRSEPLVLAYQQYAELEHVPCSKAYHLNGNPHGLDGSLRSKSSSSQTLH